MCRRSQRVSSSGFSTALASCCCQDLTRRKRRFPKCACRYTLAAFSRFATVSCERRGLYTVNYDVSRSPQKTPKCGKQKRGKSRNTLAFWRFRGVNLKRIDHGLTSRFATPNRWRVAFFHVSASIAC